MRTPTKYLMRLAAPIATIVLCWGAAAVSWAGQQGQNAVRTQHWPPECREDQLQINDAGFAGVSAGTVAEALEFRSDERCRLQGHPSVWLLSKTGRRLAVVPDQTDEPGPPVVVREGHPTYVDLYSENPSIRPKACRLEAYSMGIEAPGAAQRTTVEFETQPMRFCRGTIVVTTFGSSGPFKG